MTKKQGSYEEKEYSFSKSQLFLHSVEMKHINKTF